MAVGDSVVHDVRDVVVGEAVLDLAAAAFADDDARATQDTQVLGHEWLRDLERFYELVHAQRAVLVEQ